MRLYNLKTTRKQTYLITRSTKFNKGKFYQEGSQAFCPEYLDLFHLRVNGNSGIRRQDVI